MHLATTDDGGERENPNYQEKNKIDIGFSAGKFAADIALIVYPESQL
jgi:hypothetical protein